MDLSALQSLKERASEVSSHRQVNAESSLQEAIDLIWLAEQDGFRDQKRISEIAELFFEAIHNQPSHPEPFVGLALLLWIVGEYSDAMEYIMAALELEPENEDAILLKQTIEKKQNSVVIDTNNLQKIANDDIVDYDLLYDEVYALLEQQVHQVLQSKLLVPTYDIKQVEQLQEVQQSLQSVYDVLSEKIDIIEEEIESAELWQRMQILQKSLTRHEEIIKASDIMISLKMEISIHHQMLQQQLEHLRNSEDPLDISNMKANLEKIFDQCDGYANELDVLESKGFEPTLVTQAYEELLNTVSELDEILQEY